MSKRKKVTFDQLTKKERLVLCAVADAVKRKDKWISVSIRGKAVDVSVHPWEPERTGEWGDGTSDMVRCSECNSLANARYNYCPGCGARMEESAE